MIKIRYTSILFLLSTLTTQAQQGNEPVKVTDMLKIKSLGGVTLSRDGSKAAFSVTTIEPDGESKTDYKYTNQLWMVATDGSTTPRALTSKENASQATWSPDGRQLAFVRTADGKAQIFLLSLDGGEAIQLTKFKYGASSPSWSPDGKQLLFATSVPLKELLKDTDLNPGKLTPQWPAEKPGFDKNEQLQSSSAKADPDGSLEEVRAYLENNAADRKARVFNKLNFLDEMNVSSDMSFNHYFVVNAVPGATPVAITRGFYRFNGASFTPDGKQVIMAGDVDSLQHPDRSLESQLFWSTPMVPISGCYWAKRAKCTAARAFLLPVNGWPFNMAIHPL
ncbi:TolB family protein [Paraflavitalea speifideaquila]|uniref:TolB family protein n=1 Tax=Paraflavitalea speifideaquila TaxID=3076558 RepID=UPI0028E3B1E0|nr:DPP IV N-terminal domain-containing protein [Paraflavitalea speifideiaquila]